MLLNAMKVIADMANTFRMRGMRMRIEPYIVEIHRSSLAHLSNKITISNRRYRRRFQVPCDRVLVIPSQTDGNIEWL